MNLCDIWGWEVHQSQLSRRRSSFLVKFVNVKLETCRDQWQQFRSMRSLVSASQWMLLSFHVFQITSCIRGDCGYGHARHGGILLVLRWESRWRLQADFRAHVVPWWIGANSWESLNGARLTKIAASEECSKEHFWHRGHFGRKRCSLESWFGGTKGFDVEGGNSQGGAGVRGQRANLDGCGDDSMCSHNQSLGQQTMFFPCSMCLGNKHHFAWRYHWRKTSSGALQRNDFWWSAGCTCNSYVRKALQKRTATVLYSEFFCPKVAVNLNPLSSTVWSCTNRKWPNMPCLTPGMVLQGSLGKTSMDTGWFTEGCQFLLIPTTCAGQWTLRCTTTLARPQLTLMVMKMGRQKVPCRVLDLRTTWFKMCEGWHVMENRVLWKSRILVDLPSSPMTRWSQFSIEIMASGHPLMDFRRMRWS